MAKFRAIKPAFYGNRRIREGEVLDLPQGAEPSWAEPVAEAKPAPKKKARAKKKASKSDAKKD